MGCALSKAANDQPEALRFAFSLDQLQQVLPTPQTLDSFLATGFGAFQDGANLDPNLAETANPSELLDDISRNFSFHDAAAVKRQFNIEYSAIMSLDLHSQQRVDARALCLTSHCSLDRLHMLRHQLHHWPGAMSVALFFPPGSVGLKAEVHAMLRKWITEKKRNNIRISFVTQLQNTIPGANDACESLLYPINLLRQVALDASVSDLVLLADIDMFAANIGLLFDQNNPDRISYEQFYKECYKRCYQERSVIVLPTFEFSARPAQQAQDGYAAISKIHTKAELIRRLQSHDVRLFASRIYPKGHAKTNLNVFLQIPEKRLLKFYNTGYEEGFEPFVIAPRHLLPPYDIRFRGYGKNKIVYHYRLHAAGFKYCVSPALFLLHLPHEPSLASRAFMSSELSAMQAARIEVLYPLAKREIAAEPVPYFVDEDKAQEAALLSSSSSSSEAASWSGAGLWSSCLNMQWLATITDKAILAHVYDLFYRVPEKLAHAFHSRLETVCQHSWDSAGPVGTPGLTLVTHCTGDRFGFVLAAASKLRQAVSVAVYSDNAHPLVTEQVTDFFSKLKTVSTKVSLIWTHNPILPTTAVGAAPPYPYNYLRNQAMQGAGKTLVLLIDADCLPCERFCDVLLNDSAVVNKLTTEKLMLVVPIFELSDPSANNASGQVEEMSCFDKQMIVNEIKAGRVNLFHEQRYSRGHRPVRLDLWMSLGPSGSECYEVPYQDGYEPYVVCNSEFVPKFDERFVGYGFDRVSWFFHCALLDFKFIVHPGLWLLDQPHPASVDWNLVYGDDADSCEKIKVQLEKRTVYRRFQQKQLTQQIHAKIKAKKKQKQRTVRMSDDHVEDLQDMAADGPDDHPDDGQTSNPGDRLDSDSEGGSVGGNADDNGVMDDPMPLIILDECVHKIIEHHGHHTHDTDHGHADHTRLDGGLLDNNHNGIDDRLEHFASLHERHSQHHQDQHQQHHDQHQQHHDLGSQAHGHSAAHGQHDAGHTHWSSAAGDTTDVDYMVVAEVQAYIDYPSSGGYDYR